MVQNIKALEGRKPGYSYWAMFCNPSTNFCANLHETCETTLLPRKDLWSPLSIFSSFDLSREPFPTRKNLWVMPPNSPPQYCTVRHIHWRNFFPQINTSLNIFTTQTPSHFRSAKSQDMNLGYFYILFSMLNSCALDVHPWSSVYFQPPRSVDHISPFINLRLY